MAAPNYFATRDEFMLLVKRVEALEALVKSLLDAKPKEPKVTRTWKPKEE